jgi:hypothetical protein
MQFGQCVLHFIEFVGANDTLQQFHSDFLSRGPHRNSMQGATHSLSYVLESRRLLLERIDDLNAVTATAIRHPAKTGMTGACA